MAAASPAAAELSTDQAPSTGLIYIRGQADDFQRLERRHDPGWSWADSIQGRQRRKGAASNFTALKDAMREPRPICRLVARFVEADLCRPYRPISTGRAEGVGRFNDYAPKGRRSSSA